jgi:tRNA pseudouridine13 synthase
MSFPDDLTRTLFDEILKQKGLRPGSFRTKILRKAYFKSFPRKALILPDDLKIIEKKKDELHEAKQKMTVSFFLPRGSYGTMLVKRICLPNRQST